MFLLRPDVWQSLTGALPMWLRSWTGHGLQRWRTRKQPPIMVFVSDAANLNQTLLQHRGQSLQLLLSSSLSLQWLGDMPAKEKLKANELQAWLRQQWAPYHGDAVQGWPLAVWREATLVGGCALTGLRLPQVLQAAAAEGVRLHAMQPWWAAIGPWVLLQAPELSQAEQAHLVLVEADVVTCLLCQQGRLRQIMTRRLVAPTLQALADVLEQIKHQQLDADPDPDVERVPLPTWVAGFGLQPGDSSVLAPAQCVGDVSVSTPLLPLVSLAASPRWKQSGMSPQPALYFIAPAPRHAAWVWLCLVLLLLGNGALGSHWLSQREALQQAQTSQQAQLQRNAALTQQLRAQSSGTVEGASQAARGRTAPTAPSKEAAAVERAARQAAWRLAQEWRAHWQQVLLPLEQVSTEIGAVGWLALEHVAAQGELRLSGATLSQETMLGAVRVLSEQPGWSRVMLTRITPPGGSAVGGNLAGAGGPQTSWSFDLTARVQHMGLVAMSQGVSGETQP